MKRAGRLMVTMAGVATLVGFAYRGPIMEMANAFKEEVTYFFSINAESALEGKIGDKDIDAMANQLEGINDDVEAPDWSMENATGEVFDVFIDRFPFIQEAGDWVSKNLLGKEVQEGDNITLDDVIKGADALVDEVKESIESGSDEEDITLVTQIKSLVAYAKENYDEESLKALLDDIEANVTTLKEVYGEDDKTIVEIEKIIEEASQGIGVE